MGCFILTSKYLRVRLPLFGGPSTSRFPTQPLVLLTVELPKDQTPASNGLKLAMGHVESTLLSQLSSFLLLLLLLLLPTHLSSQPHTFLLPWYVSANFLSQFLDLSIAFNLFMIMVLYKNVFMEGGRTWDFEVKMNWVLQCLFIFLCRSKILSESWVLSNTHSFSNMEYMGGFVFNYCWSL